MSNQPQTPSAACKATLDMLKKSENHQQQMTDRRKNWAEREAALEKEKKQAKMKEEEFDRRALNEFIKLQKRIEEAIAAIHARGNVEKPTAPAAATPSPRKKKSAAYTDAEMTFIYKIMSESYIDKERASKEGKKEGSFSKKRGQMTAEFLEKFPNRNKEIMLGFIGKKRTGHKIKMGATLQNNGKKKQKKPVVLLHCPWFECESIFTTEGGRRAHVAQHLKRFPCEVLLDNGHHCTHVDGSRARLHAHVKTHPGKSNMTNAAITGRKFSNEESERMKKMFKLRDEIDGCATPTSSKTNHALAGKLAALMELQAQAVESVEGLFGVFTPSPQKQSKKMAKATKAAKAAKKNVCVDQVAILAAAAAAELN